MRRAMAAGMIAIAACGGGDGNEGLFSSSGAPPGVDGGTLASGDAATDAASARDAADANSASSEEFSGEATYYDANGSGACGLPRSNDFMVAAINDEQYSKANCGKCVEVTGPRGTVVVRIVDKCPGCNHGDLDLSQTAFGRIARLTDGRVRITWRFTTCP